MEWIESLFGKGTELTMLQISLRALVVFLLALVMLRVTGHRTFGHKSVIDNVVIIMLGALLSRGITGASPFLPVMCASLVIVLLHRLLAWLALYNQSLSRLIKGERISLFRNGKPQHENMRKTLVSHEDVMEGVRLQTNKDSVEKIIQIYMESSGEMSVIEREEREA